MRIEAVFGTHVHADHRAGERRLADASGAALYHHRSADVAYPFEPLDDGMEISLGNVVVRVVHTPGHTPESVSLLVTDRSRAAEPWMVLTGDTLFVGDVGRPDLGDAQAGRDLQSSLRRLLELPDYVEVYPAHISGSPCGRGMSAKPSSTIGFERRHNPALQHLGDDRFVASLFEGLPEAPPHFASIIAANRSSS